VQAVRLACEHDAVACKLTRDASRAAKAGPGCACSYSRPCASVERQKRVDCRREAMRLHGKGPIGIITGMRSA
jgi:hypothetical protein